MSRKEGRIDIVKLKSVNLFTLLMSVLMSVLSLAFSPYIEEQMRGTVDVREDTPLKSGLSFAT